MDINYSFDQTKTYFDGVLLAAFGIRAIGGTVAEWQIDSVKESVLKFKEVEIEHSMLSENEKNELKHQNKQWLDTITRGLKDKLKEEGRLV